VAKSFNSSRFSPEWKGFTLKWYSRLFERDDIFAALVNSLKVAVIAASASMLLGTCAAFALHRYKSRLQDAHRVMVNVPLVLPDILMGMSLLLLFIAAGVSLSLATVTIAHITPTATWALRVGDEPDDDDGANGMREMARRMTMVVRPLPTATSVRAISTLSSLTQTSASSMP
jgi:ABC-type spermidine/putrescine transport system permease subunit II